MRKKDARIFKSDIPPDLEHAPQLREEVLDWLETQYPGSRSFTPGQVLRMAAEPERRWLITRLRARKIGDSAEFSSTDTADALTALFLRSRGVKFKDAVDAVVARRSSPNAFEPRYGGVWNRLILAALEGLRRRLPARLLASAVYALLRNPTDQVNCLVIVNSQAKPIRAQPQQRLSAVPHDSVYHTVLERPAPSCAVVSPSREIMFFSRDQLPAHSEIISRHFVALNLTTDLTSYNLMLGTMKPVNLIPDPQTLKFVGRILDILYPQFDSFVQAQSSSRLETPVQPEQASAGDLQLWLITQLLACIYPGSLCEIGGTLPHSHLTRVLASSVTTPWEPSPWEPAKNLEMLSGYASITGAPLVVDKVEYPWTAVIEGVEAELRY